jgi:5'-3' exonuclease
MGIKKGNMFVQKHLEDEIKHLKDLSNIYIGIDFCGMLHRFIRDNIDIPDNYILQLINIIEKFKSCGIIPIFVIDGSYVIEKTNKLKINRLVAKDKLQRLQSLSCKSNIEIDIDKEKKLKHKSLSVTKEHIRKCKEIFSKLDCICIHIYNYEADAILALLSKLNIIEYVYSEDFDMFLYTDIKYILQGLDYNTNTFKVYSKQKLLNTLNITSQQLIDIAFLTGTDYNCGLYKSTLQSNLDLIRIYETFENIIKNIDLINLDRKVNCKILLPKYNFNYEFVRQIFTLENIDNNVYYELFNMTDSYTKNLRPEKKNTLSNFFKVKNVLEVIQQITQDSYMIKKYSEKVIAYCHLHFGITINIDCDYDYEYDYNYDYNNS